MALNAANVRTGIAGEVSVAPTTATFPTTAAAALVGFTGMGYLAPAGIVPKGDKSTTDLTAFQNNTVARTLVTGAKRTYEFTLWETSKATIEFAYATTVTQAAAEGSYTIDPGASGGRRKFVIDVVDGAVLHREMFEGELTGMEESGWVNGEAVAFKCTVTVYGTVDVKDTSLKTP